MKKGSGPSYVDLDLNSSPCSSYKATKFDDSSDMNEKSKASYQNITPPFLLKTRR